MVAVLDVVWELNNRPEANHGAVAVGRLRPSILPYQWMKLYRWLILAALSPVSSSCGAHHA